MNTEMKCELILRKMLEVANSGNNLTLEEDFGGNTLTVMIGNKHSHVGCPGCSFDNLVDNLYNLICENKGLSWN